MSAVNTYSQSGEDLQVWNFFGGRPSGFFVEVGANEPEALSQTRFLEEHGWRGMLVEPIPDYCARLREARPGSSVHQVACGAPEQRGPSRFRVAAVGDRSSLVDNGAVDPEVEIRAEIEVQICTLDELLEKEGGPKVDFVSIDVEGGELNVLRGFDLVRHRPGLLLIEDYVYALDVHRHMVRNGYRLVRRTGSNNWYVPADSAIRPGAGEAIRLFRKMHLATPLRRLKRWLRRAQ